MTPASDQAFVQLGDGRIVIGAGPFERLEAPPADGSTCFYWNDFDLSSGRPWRRPASVWVAEPGEWPGRPAGGGTSIPLAVSWMPVQGARFRRAFDSAREAIATGVIRKIVPVWSMRGRADPAQVGRLVGCLAELPDALRGYGRIGSSGGFVGATPEVLFELAAGRLTTMALAGTAGRGTEEDLEQDGKQIHEHREVVDAIVGHLALLGSVEVGPRRVIDVGAMIHLQTPISVELEPAGTVTGTDWNRLIRTLHPTPAIGVAPRSPEGLALLHALRREADIPDAFAAPFGVVHEGNGHFLVAIRAVFWDAEGGVTVPAGCGIVAESEFDQEWDEVQLKVNAVRHQFRCAIFEGENVLRP